MTNEDRFFQVLSALNRDWAFYPRYEGGRIVWVLRSGHDCPMTAACRAVTGQQFETSNYAAAGFAMGLEGYFIENIALIADGGGWSVPDLARRLFEACGIRKPADAN